MLILETFDYDYVRLNVRTSSPGMYLDADGDKIPKIKIYGEHKYFRNIRGGLSCQVDFGDKWGLNYQYELATYPNGKPIKLFT